MVKRYTSWDVVTDVGENIFVLEADYATLLAERDRLRDALNKLYETTGDLLAHRVRYFSVEYVYNIAGRAMEGRDERSDMPEV